MFASSQQQFWDAFTSPLPPQMFPGGLQPWPPSQTWFAPHVTLYDVFPPP
jgi:hypothetical protein